MEHLLADAKQRRSGRSFCFPGAGLDFETHPGRRRRPAAGPGSERRANPAGFPTLSSLSSSSSGEARHVPIPLSATHRRWVSDRGYFGAQGVHGVPGACVQRPGQTASMRNDGCAARAGIGPVSARAPGRARDPAAAGCSSEHEDLLDHDLLPGDHGLSSCRSVAGTHTRQAVTRRPAGSAGSSLA